jgi:hypothetical protein
MSEKPVELAADDDVSLEIYVRNGLGEKIELDSDDDGLIWAPILRSGTHATRPGPYGEKLREPLVIVPGRASDPTKEIGLENLLENFNRGAVQHVTIPTTHDNGVLENNGYIEALKIVDSTARPGERVLMGAHRITEPDVRGRLERGSVANRSCGILHNYVNTESGETFDQVLEHVALTNKPWIRGMPAYGELATAELSDRKVVPMMLSETPVNPAKAANPANPDAFAEPAGMVDDKLGAVSTRMTEAERKAEFQFADNVQWGDTPSFNQIRSQLLGQLDAMRGDDEDGYPYFFVMDVTPDKALIRCEYGDPDGQDDAWVVPYTADSQGVRLSSFDQWTPVTQAWITDEDADRDKQELGSILGSGGLPLSLSLSEAKSIHLAISQAERDKAAKEGNALPDGSYPIRNAKELRAAAILAASGHGNVAAAKRLIRKRAKELGVDVSTLPGFGGDEKKTNTSEWLPPQQERHNQQGGAMKPTTDEALARLELSEEARAVVERLAQENAQIKSQLAESRREAHREKVAARVKELQAQGHTPGFCAAYEEIALADDGEVALVINLSENGGSPRPTNFTATQLAERLIAALPVKQDGTLDNVTQLTADPLAGRPALDPDDDKKQRGDDKPKDGLSLLDEWAKAAPELAHTEFAEAVSATAKKA